MKYLLSIMVSLSILNSNLAMSSNEKKHVKCSAEVINKKAKGISEKDIKFLGSTTVLDMSRNDLPVTGFIYVDQKCDLKFASKDFKTITHLESISPCSEEKVFISALGKLKEKVHKDYLPNRSGIICNSLAEESGCTSICRSQIDGYGGRDKFCKDAVLISKEHKSDIRNNRCYQSCCK